MDLNAIIRTAVFVILFIIVARVLSISNLKVISRWKTFFDAFSIEPSEFYALLEKRLLERNLQNVSISETSYWESSIVGPGRLYLKISRNQVQFNVCAAPVSTGFFFSYWQTSDFTLPQKILMAIIGVDRAQKMMGTTFFRIDVEDMHMSIIHQCVIETVEEVTANKGLRTMTDSEKQFAYRDVFKERLKRQA
jgi:hypothetical protein